MKNTKQIILIIAILMGSISFGLTAHASIYINNITLADLENHNAKMEWRTNLPTRSIVHYGAQADDLEYTITRNDYKNYHEVILNHLNEDETYYYKIIAFSQSGEASETFIHSFDTDDMEDTIKPRFIKAETLQITGDAIAIRWRTNEKTKATIHYGIRDTDQDKTTSYNKYHTDHSKFIYRLEPNSAYYLRIVAKDKQGNTQSKTINFYTNSVVGDKDLEIKNIVPNGFDAEIISTNTAVITWKTNLIAKSYIQYGVKSKRLNKKVYVDEEQRKFNHRIVLTELEPNTTYYYKIKAYDSLYRKSKTTRVMSFTTSPTQKKYVLGTQIINDNIDNDHDGLSNSYELSLGTNPNNPDTDGDSYPDGLEIDNGYDPLGPGRVKAFAYNKPRLGSDYEMAKSIELKQDLENILGDLNLKAQDWFTVVNAYIYGEYPVEAIAQSIKHSGKTVHPNIAWDFWQRAKDYLNFINL